MLLFWAALGWFTCTSLGSMWCQQLPRFIDKPRHWSFAPPWISPACPRSFRIRAGYLTRSCPQVHTGWNVLPWTSDSLTTLRVCSSADGPGLLQRGAPPQASPIQHLAGQGVHSSGLPPLAHVARRRTSLSRTCVLFYARHSAMSRRLHRRQFNAVSGTRHHLFPYRQIQGYCMLSHKQTSCQNGTRLT